MNSQKKINPVLDGRYLTEWSPSCILNQKISASNGNLSQRDYKKFLINNGEVLMNSQSSNVKKTLDNIDYMEL